MVTTEISNPVWAQQPGAAELIGDLFERFRQGSPEIVRLEQRLHDETGTRLVDWTDSLFVSSDPDLLHRLDEVGFRCGGENSNIWQHAGGLFPFICCDAPFFNEGAAAEVLTIKVDCVDDFSRLYCDGAADRRGKPGSPLRTAMLPSGDGPRLAAVERHGWREFTRPTVSSRQIAQADKHRRAFARRTRDCGVDAAGFQGASALVDAAAADLGVDWTSDLFFAAERQYWMSRNRAAQAQYDRQQRLGLGWGNHDHHTYRSSRASFQNLISLLEQLGLYCRERFHAGRESG
jgi:hypothetical protein